MFVVKRGTIDSFNGDETMIYISYGLRKSASSFVYQMVDKAASLYAKNNNLPKFNLKDLFPVCVNPDYADLALESLGFSVNADGLEKLVNLIEFKLNEFGGGTIVLKTHCACSEQLAIRIASKEILASACFRHPAEMILSLRDMNNREGEKEETMSELMQVYQNKEIPAFFSWANLQFVEKFFFDDIISASSSTAASILKQFHIEVSAQNLFSIMIGDKKSIWQFNKGILSRHELEMTSEQIHEIENEFSEYMQYINNHKINAQPTKWLFTIALVTPTLNSATTIDETILSVISQKGDFAIRYHIQDGGSTDGTVERIEKWAQLLRSGSPCIGCNAIDFTYSVAQDSGVYDALNKAFKQVSGDVYSWLGSDDRLANGCMQSIKSLLEAHPDIHWVTGSTSLLREDGVVCATSPLELQTLKVNLFPRKALEVGLADGATLPIIQQEGTFWTEWLWQAVGKQLRSDLSLAGDFELWTRMAKYSELVSVLAPLGFFRFRQGQLSSNMEQYMKEVRAVQRLFLDKTRSKVIRDVARGNLTAHVASVSMPSPAWKVEVVNLPAGNPYWAPVSGIGLKEGPFPELGITKPFHWLLGKNATLNLLPMGSGSYKVRFRMRNYLRGQVVIIHGAGFYKKTRAPISRPWRKSFIVDMVINMPDEELEVKFEFSNNTVTNEDVRERALMLLDLTVHRVK